MSIHRLAAPAELRKLLAQLEGTLATADALGLDRVGIDIATACDHLQRVIDAAER